MTVPYTFANAAGTVPASELDANFAAVGAYSDSAGNAVTVTASAQPNITSVGNLISVHVTGNASAQYFIGDGSLLTNVVSTSSYGNSNVAAYLPTYGGTFGNVIATGNVSGNYILGDGSQLTNLPSQPGTYGNSNVAAYLPTYSGNVSGNYFLGNGSQLTGIVSSYGNSNVASYLTTYTGNLSAGNISATSKIETSGNAVISGTLQVGAGLTVVGGYLLTGNANAYVFNYDASNLAIGGNANIITVGASTGTTAFAGTIKLAVTTVNALPSAATAGAGTKAFVSDANTITFYSNVGNGGSNLVPVFSNGTNWLVG